MARLTEEQKALNKALQKGRDKAYRERRQAYLTARDAALEAFSRDSTVMALNTASEALEAGVRARNAEKLELQNQIAALQAEIAALDSKHNIAALVAARRQASSAWLAAKDAVELQVNAEFTDVARVYSAVEWAAKGHYPPAN